MSNFGLSGNWRNALNFKGTPSGLPVAKISAEEKKASVSDRSVMGPLALLVSIAIFVYWYLA